MPLHPYIVQKQKRQSEQSRSRTPETKEKQSFSTWIAQFFSRQMHRQNSQVEYFFYISCDVLFCRFPRQDIVITGRGNSGVINFTERILGSKLGDMGWEIYVQKRQLW